MPIQVRLIVVGGKASKADVALKLPSVIGRSREAGLSIAHPMVSRRHCEVFEADGLMMIRDLGSLNGTLVAGKRIKESPLPPDCEFTVGPLTFRTQYQCERELSKLPPPVLAEQDVAVTTPLAPVESLAPDVPVVNEPAPALDASVAAKEEVGEGTYEDELLDFLSAPQKRKRKKWKRQRRNRRWRNRRRRKKQNQNRRPRPKIERSVSSRRQSLRPCRSPSPRRRPSKSRWLKKNLKSSSRLSN